MKAYFVSVPDERGIVFVEAETVAKAKQEVLKKGFFKGYSFFDLRASQIKSEEEEQCK